MKLAGHVLVKDEKTGTMKSVSGSEIARMPPKMTREERRRASIQRKNEFFDKLQNGGKFVFRSVKKEPIPHAINQQPTIEAALILRAEPIRLSASRPYFSNAVYVPLFHVVGMPNRKKKVYAVVYVDDGGDEKRIWYPNRKKAEAACQRLQRQCRVEIVEI